MPGSALTPLLQSVSSSRIVQLLMNLASHVSVALQTARERQVGFYRKDTEPLYHAFMYSPIILLSSIYPFMQCLSLLVTII